MREITVEEVENWGEWEVREGDTFLALFANAADAHRFAEWKRLEAHG